MAAIIRSEDLTKRFGSIVALKCLNLSVEAGEFFGLLGPNGAGKTTAVNIFCSLLRPTSGVAFVDKFDVSRDSGSVRMMIGLVPQEPSLYLRLTGRETLMFVGSLLRDSKEEIRKRADELLSWIGLEEAADRQVGTYSGGMRQKLNLIAALVHDPSVLFLDEPTLGLDPSSRREVWKFLLDLKEEGKTIFLTTHYMQEAEELCDRVGILSRGELRAVDSPAALVERLGTTGEVTFVASQPSDLVDLLESQEFIGKVERSDGTIKVHLKDIETDLQRLFHLIEGKEISSTQVRHYGLEEAFLTLTREEE